MAVPLPTQAIYVMSCHWH